MLIHLLVSHSKSFPLKRSHVTNVTGLEKTGLINIKYTFSFYSAYLSSCSGDSRLSIQGGHYSKIRFKVRPLYITLHFLHLCTLKIGLKLHVCVLKILGLPMPMHMSTFHHDFPQLIFTRGAVPAPP